MGWAGREPSSVFRHPEQLDGRENWFLTVAPSIVLAIAKSVCRQSNEEQDVQTEFMGKVQQFRGPLIQTPSEAPSDNHPMDTLGSLMQVTSASQAPLQLQVLQHPRHARCLEIGSTNRPLR